MADVGRPAVVWFVMMIERQVTSLHTAGGDLCRRSSGGWRWDGTRHAVQPTDGIQQLKGYVNMT
jgi:hypothetical protein